MNRTVVFFLTQSFVLIVFVVLVNTTLTVTRVLSFLVPFLSLAEFSVWLFSIYSASQGREWEIPVLGKCARRLMTYL